MQWDKRESNQHEGPIPQLRIEHTPSLFVQQHDRDSESIKMDYSIFYRDSETAAREKVSKLTGVSKSELVVSNASHVFADHDGYYIQYDVQYGPGQYKKVKVTSFGPNITATEHKNADKILDFLNDKRKWVQIT